MRVLLSTRVREVVQDSEGNLYGAAVDGGASKDGSIYSLTTRGHLLWSFSFAGTNGSSPRGGLIPGGDDLFFRSEAKAAAIADLKKQGKYKEGMIIPEAAALGKAKEIGEMLWKNGLPVLDDLHNSSYDWNMSDVDNKTDKEIQKWYTDHYIESIGRLSPGLTMVIMHCTMPSANFKYICKEECSIAAQNYCRKFD